AATARAGREQLSNNSAHPTAGGPISSRRGGANANPAPKPGRTGCGVGAEDSVSVFNVRGPVLPRARRRISAIGGQPMSARFWDDGAAPLARPAQRSPRRGSSELCARYPSSADEGLAALDAGRGFAVLCGFWFMRVAESCRGEDVPVAVEFRGGDPGVMI